MELLQESPFVRQALRARMTAQGASADLFIPLQSRDSRFFYIFDGRGEMRIGDRIFPLCRDAAILFKAGTEYEWRIEAVEYAAINFDYSQRFCKTVATFHPLPAATFSERDRFDCGRIEDIPCLEAPLFIEKAFPLKPALQRILSESAMGDGWSRPLLSAMMKQLLLETVRLAGEGNSPPSRGVIVREVIAYLQGHYTEPIDNGTVAAAFGYHPTYLGRIFKEQTGTPLHAFVAELRMQASFELLADPALSIGQVCRLVGIPNIYHFSRLFKAKTGCSPSEYRAALFRGYT